MGKLPKLSEGEIIDLNRRTESVIEGLARGTSLRTLLNDELLDSTEFFRSVSKSPVLARLYADSQRMKAELIVEEMIDIADTEVDVVRARNRIDARRWYASKINYKKYGDKLDVQLTHTVDISGALTEARQRSHRGDVD